MLLKRRAQESAAHQSIEDVEGLQISGGQLVYTRDVSCVLTPSIRCGRHPPASVRRRKGIASQYQLCSGSEGAGRVLTLFQRVR